MFWDEEVTPEDEDEIIEWVAQQLYKYGMETAAIMFLESLKPISRYGSSMGQMVVSPLLPFLGDNIMVKGDKALKVFEDNQNIERLIQRLEDLAVNGLDAKQEIKQESEYQENKEAPEEENKGWRKYLPF
jgi:hypothetical protein